MANIKTELSENNKVKITFYGKQPKHIRLTNSWTDWMLGINDFRDFIIPLPQEDVDFIISSLINNPNRTQFVNTSIGQEYNLENNKKIIRRLGQGYVRKEYQSVALFIKNVTNTLPPEPFEISRDEILLLIRAMITLDCPANRCIRDSLRNLQYLLAILWVKKDNPKLLQGEKKPKADEIFRISLVK